MRLTWCIVGLLALITKIHGSGNISEYRGEDF